MLFAIIYYYAVHHGILELMSKISKDIFMTMKKKLYFGVMKDFKQIFESKIEPFICLSFKSIIYKLLGVFIFLYKK